MALLDTLSKAMANIYFGGSPAAAAPPAKRSMSPLNTPAILQSGGGAGAIGFAAAKFNRLTSDFLTSSRSADQDLFGDNRALRSRARKLAIDNPFARKFLQMMVQNVVGHQGVLMQAKVTGANGKPMKRVNRRIEAEWARWCKVGRCTADGKFSFRDLQQMAVKNLGREGENLLKKVYGREFNDVGYALQPLDNDQLDDTMMQSLGNGGEVRMGVEVNPYRRPMAYWLWDGHPYDMIPGSRVRRRIPAADIIHSYVSDRPGQTRGYTMMAASILEINHYGKYVEAELVAARASAAKFMVIESDVAEGFTGEDEDEAGSDTNPDGTQIMTANAGEGLRLDPGERMNFIDPKHPTQAFRDFSRTAIRNIATGLLVSYPSLGNDLEGVNFSSIRAGLLDERDCWRILQRWFIDHFMEPVYLGWVEMARLTVLKDVELTAEQWEQVTWKPRGWEWVDPLKDAQATTLRLQNGFSTYADELGNLGRDFEETVDERQREQAYIEAAGVRFGTDIRGIADTATDDQKNAAAGGEEGQQGGAGQ